MTDSPNSFEKAFTTSIVADMVGIAESTLRKYSLALEKEGYKIIRDDNNARVFVENDVIVIRELREIRERLKINVEDAARYVVTRVPVSSTQTVSLDDTVKLERYDERYSEFEKKIDMQNDLLQILFKKIDEQNHKVEKMLLNMQEERKEKEQLLLDTQSQSLKSFLSRLFSKK